MARETITRLVDDLDGGVAHETVRFGLDGRLYEIDLSSKNAKKLRSELASFIEHGSRIPGRAPTPPARRVRRVPVAGGRPQGAGRVVAGAVLGGTHALGCCSMTAAP